MFKGIYIGNRLQKRNYTSIVDHIGGRLSGKYKMVLASKKANKIVRMLDFIFKVVWHGRTADFLIVDVFSTINFYYALIVTQLCRSLRLPYITNLHGGNLPQRLTKNRYLCDLIFRHAAINVAPSNYLFSKFRDAGYQVTLIPNSIEIDNYLFKKRRCIEPKILFVRAFKELYNPAMAIHMMNILSKNHPKATLTMYGPHLDNSYHTVKDLIAEYQLESKISILGSVPKEVWAADSVNYDILINTTNIDNTPFSLIEAMALGLPVVSTNVGGVPYLIADNENGLLVEKDDHKMMAEKIELLLGNPNLVEVITQSARKGIEKFDWEGSIKPLWIESIEYAISQKKITLKNDK